jgi:tripartite-type tricarboxylate transporter receptor subunit TctC
MGMKPHPEIKGVPMAIDLARTAADRQVMEVIFAKFGMSRPFMAPPDLPPARLAMLRTAFMATMKDAAFIEDARRSKLDLEPQDGEHLAALVAKIYATPKPIVDKIANLIK